MSLNLRNLTIICLFILFSGNILAQGSLSIASITTEDVSCLNGNDGSITITIQGGQPPYTYTWIRLPFAFDQIISNETTVTFPGNFPITATSYLIDISDSLGNNVSGNAIVNQPSSAVAVSIAPDPAQTCSGNDLQLSGNASGGTPPYTHLWSGAGAAFLNDPTIENPIFNSTEGGDYELSYTLTDDNGCFTSQTITVSNTDNPQTNAGSDDQQCGNSYELNATQSFGTGTWTASGPGSASFSNINDPNAEVTVDLPGTYTFTWTEVNNGCSDADDVLITFNANPDFTSNLTNPSTPGGSDGAIEINVSAGQAPFLYVLTDELGGETIFGPDPSTTHTFSNLSEGIYNIRVTDANGCFVNQNRSLATNPVLSLNITTTATCGGENNGAIDIEILSGTQPYDVQITTVPDGNVVFSETGTNLTTFSIPDLAAGNYNVEVSDNDGGFQSTDVTIDQGPLATITYPGSPFCGDGTADVTLDGFPGGTFSASPAGLDIDPTTGTINLTNSSNGNYTVSYEYTDGTCTAVAQTTVVLGELSSVTISYDESPYCQQVGGIAPVTINGQVLNSSDNTYVMGRISTDVKAQPMPGDDSSCPGTLVVSVPANAVVTAVDVSYSMTSSGVSRIIDQRSQLRCVSPGGTAESVITYGFINSTGSYTYNRTGLDIANGVTGGGDLVFELHAWRAFPTLGGCSNTSTWVDNGTWTVTVHYTSGHEFVASSEDLIVDSVTGDIDLENSLPGTYEVFYNYTEGECAGSASTSVTILAAPATPLAENSEVCFDGQEHFFNVVAPVNATLIWYDAPVGGNEIPTPSESEVGSYTVWVASQSPEGCLSEREEVSLSIIEAPAPPVPVNIIDCFNGSVYTASATVEPDAELIWYTSETGDDLSNAPSASEPGVYTAWAAARIGSCESDRVEVTLTILENPEAPQAINEDYCFDGNTYQASAVPPEGATIAWYANQSGLQTADAPSGSAVGTYTAWAASVIGECESERVQVTLTIHALPEASFAYIADSFCQTPDTGYLPIITTEETIVDQVFTVTTDDGSDPEGLIINQTTGEIFPGQSVPGTYTIEFRYGIEIITSNGSIFCYNETSLDITIDAGPELLVENVTDVLCAGTETGSITVSVSSGTAPFTYELLDAGLNVVATTVANNTDAQIFENLAAGSWYVRVNDANSCNTISEEIIINEASPITIDPGSVSSTDVSCFNGTDGQISFTATGGTGELSYSLLQGGSVVFGPQDSGTFTGLAAGTYDLQVEDEAGCIFDYSESITISQPNAIVLNVAANPDIACENDEATIEASATEGVAPYSFTLWLGGTQVGGPVAANADELIQFTGLTQSGEYTVSVQDANNCTTEQTITISTPVLITVFDITSDPASGEFCEGDDGVTLGLSGSETGIQYQLLRGSTVVETLTGTGNALNFGTFTENGTYTVLATETISGCTRDMNGSIDVVTLPTPVVEISTFDPVDYCANDIISTFITASPGFSSYQWYRNDQIIAGATAANYNAEEAGTYTVWVEDANGCTAVSDSITITTYELPTATFSYESNEFCESIDPSTGYLPIIVTEDVIMDQVFTITNSIPADAELIINQSTGEIFPGQSTAGTFTILYRYGSSISTGPGVDDFILCYNEYEIDITINPSPEISIVDVDNVLCAGEATGAITVVAPGGQPPFTYELLNESLQVVATIVATNDQPVTFDLLAAGTYYIGVDDANTCTALSDEVVVSEPDAIVIDPVNLVVTQISCNGAGDGAIEVVAQGGTGELLYTLLQNGTILFENQTSGIFTGLTEGAYTIQVSDENNCSYEYPQVIDIIEPEAIAVSAAANPDITCEGDEATIEASATQGVAPYTFTLWLEGAPQGGPVSGNEGETIQFTGLTQSGDYTVRVQDTNGCTQEQIVTISVPVIIAIFDITSDPVSGEYCPENDGVILGLSGSEPNIQYQLILESNVVATLTGTGNALNFGTFTENGTYTVIATDTISGCARDMNGSIDVVTLPAPVVEISTFDPVDYCANDIISTFITATPGFSSYQWYRNDQIIAGATAANYNAEEAGTYTVWVEDANGCTAVSDSITITIYELPTATFSYESDEFCESLDPAIGFMPIVETEDVIVDQIFTVVSSQPDGAMLSMVQTTGEIFPGQSDAGTYTILYRYGSFISTGPGVDDVILCYGEYEIQITINQSPSLTVLETQDAVCAGDATGFITVAASGGQLPYTYELLDVDSNVLQTIIAETADPQTFENLGFGIYTITVTDSNSCGSTLSDPVTIDEPDPIAIDPLSLVITPVSCFGANDGQMELTANGGTGILNYYLLQNGDTLQGPVSGSASFTGLAPGSYFVAIIDEADCNIVSEELLITEPDAIVLDAITNPDMVCEGDEASIEAIATMGVAPYTFTLWFEGTQTGETLIAEEAETVIFPGLLTPGTYTVRVSDANGCQAEQQTQVSEPQQLTLFTIGSQGDSSYCMDGQGVEIVLDGSETGIDYLLFLDGTHTGSTIAGTGSAISFGLQTESGIYTIMATDSATGCQAMMNGSVEVIILPLPQVFNVTGGGDYCEGTDGVEAGLDGSQLDVDYFLLLDGTQTGISVAGTGDSISFGLLTDPGVYTVLAESSLTGCNNLMQGNATIESQPLPLVFNITGGGNYCENGAGVEIGLDSSQEDVTYYLILDNTDTIATTNGTGSAVSFGLITPAGSYTAAAEVAATGCTVAMDGEVQVGLFSLPIVYNVIGGGTFCSGEDGMEVGLDGSETGISYFLYLDGSPTGDIVDGTGDSITFGLKTLPGIYTVLAVNQDTGCESDMTGQAEIEVLPLPEVTISYDAPVFCPDGTADVVITTTATIVSGTFTADPVDGLDIDPITGTVNLANSETGTYQVQYQFTVENGCDNTATTTIEISEGPQLASITTQDLTCAGVPTGSITAEVSAGALPYAYELLDEEMNVLETFIALTTDPHTFEELAAGIYYVNVSDTNGCGNSLSDAIIIDEPDAITIDPLSFQFTNISCNGENDGQVQLTANGGSGILEYTLTSNGMPVQDTQTGSANFTGLEPGIYTIVISDEAGCTVESEEFEIIEPQEIVLSATTNPDIICAGNEATIEASATQGNAPFTFTLWFNGEQTADSLTAGEGESIFFSPITTPGTYTVRVTDANGCMKEVQTVVSEAQIFAVFNVTSLGDNTFCFDEEGVEITLDGSETGIDYILFLDGSDTGISAAGSGDTISFGIQNESGIYTVLASDPVTGCQQPMSGSVEVTVFPLPSLFTVTGGGDFCEGTEGVEVGLDGSETGVIYDLLLDGIETTLTVEGTGDSISFGLITEPGIYTISATTAAGCTNMMTGSVEVTQNPLPQASITASDLEICQDGTVTLTASGGDSYLWTAVPEYDFNGTENDPEITVILSQTTTFTLTAFNSCGSDTDEVTIQVVPTPEIDLGGEIFACQGESVILDAGAFENSTYLWSDGSTNQTLEVTESGLYWVEVTRINTTCVSYGEVNVVFHELPQALVAEDQTICAGDQVFIGMDEGLEPIPANTYLWTSEPEDSSLTDPTISNPMVSPMVTTTYTLVETYIESGCTNSNSVTITVIEATADAGPDQDICQDDSVIIGPEEVDENLLYSWTSSNPEEIFDNNIPNPVVSPQETTTYTLQVQHAELGCISNDEVVVSVNPAPNAETGPDLDICPGDVVTIGMEYNEPMPLNTYLWISEPNDESISDPTVSNPTVSPQVTTTYTLIETYVLTGCTTENSVVVTVHDYPVANVIDDRVVCVDEVINLATGSAQDGLTYSWTSVPQGFFSSDANPEVIPSLYQLDENNQITFILEVSNGFCSASASVTITVQPLPEVIIAEDMVFCSAADAQNVAIGGEAIEGYTYLWTSDQDDEFSSTEANPQVSPTETTVYTVVVTDGQTGCSATGQVVVTINDLLIVNQGNPEVCENSESAMLGTFLEIRGGVQPYQYFWTDAGGNQISNEPNPEVQAPFSTVYNLMVMDSLGCMANTSVEVIIIESPEVAIHIGNMLADDTYSIYSGQSVVFEAMPSGLDLYEFYVVDPTEEPDPDEEGNEDEKSGIPGARLVQSGAFNTWTTSELMNGQQVYVLGYAGECPGMSQVVTIVLNELPNAFTPDEDGINDIFGAGAELTIFNRWGQKVYEGTDGWNGTFNGRKVSPGTYYYLLSVYDQDNNKNTVKGSVTVILK